MSNLVPEDVISSPETASAIKLINGVEATKYLADTIDKANWSRDVNSAYNSLFFQQAGQASGLGTGYFSSGGRTR